MATEQPGADAALGWVFELWRHPKGSTVHLTQDGKRYLCGMDRPESHVKGEGMGDLTRCQRCEARKWAIIASGDTRTPETKSTLEGLRATMVDLKRKLADKKISWAQYYKRALEVQKAIEKETGQR